MMSRPTRTQVRRRNISKISCTAGTEGGNAERQQLAPGLLQIKADALGEAEGGVAEGHGAVNPAQHGVVDERGLCREVKLMKWDSGLKAKGQSDLTEQIVEVLMKQTQRANADADEEKCLKPLVGSNQDKEFVVPLSLLIQSSRRFGHVFWRLGACTRRLILSYVSLSSSVRWVEAAVMCLRGGYFLG